MDWVLERCRCRRYPPADHSQPLQIRLLTFPASVDLYTRCVPAQDQRAQLVTTAQILSSVSSRRRFGVLLRRARARAGIGQRELARMLPAPWEGRPFDQVWISRCECGAFPPPHPQKYEPVYRRLESSPIDLPRFARSAAYVELVLNAIAPVVDGRDLLRPRLRSVLEPPTAPSRIEQRASDLVLASKKLEDVGITNESPPQSANSARRKRQAGGAFRVHQKDLPPEYPELFDILAVGYARVQIGLEEIEASPPPGMQPAFPLSETEVQQGLVRRQFKRMGSSPQCGKVEERARNVSQSGLLREVLHSWAADAFDPDLADAWIHLGAELRMGAITEGEFPLELTLGA